MGCDKNNPCRWLAKTGYPGLWHVRILMAVELDVSLFLVWPFLRLWETIFRPPELPHILTLQIIPFLQGSFFVCQVSHPTLLVFHHHFLLLHYLQDQGCLPLPRAL